MNIGPTPADLRSLEYETWMAGDWDARHSTPEARARYGVWRWQGMREYRDVLLPEFLDAGVIVDFGGALGPLGLGSACVDIAPVTIWGERTYSLPDIISLHTDDCDVVFTSHTLEHVPDYEQVLAELTGLVKKGGLFIAHVPHVSSEWWWPENKLEHRRVFLCDLLDEYHGPREFGRSWLADDIDRGDNFNIEINRRCGDGSMMVVARKYA